MKTIIIDHSRCSPPTMIKSIFGTKIVQKYYTSAGIVEEISYPSGKLPKYKLITDRKLREPIKVEFI